MSKDIGKIDIYDIYAPCYSNMETAYSRARCVHSYSVASYAQLDTASILRNPLKEKLLERFGRYTGPDECIDDHVERKYFDNATVGSMHFCLKNSYCCYYCEYVGQGGNTCGFNGEDWRVAHLH